MDLEPWSTPEASPEGGEHRQACALSEDTLARARRVLGGGLHDPLPGLPLGLRALQLVPSLFVRPRCAAGRRAAVGTSGARTRTRGIIVQQFVDRACASVYCGSLMASPDDVVRIDPQQPLVEVDVHPTQGDQLAAPRAAGD